MGRDDRHACALLPGEKIGRTGLDQRHGEDRAHGGTHGFHREGIGALANEDDTARAGRIGRADDRAEIARVAHAVERHIGLAVCGPEVAQVRPALRKDADDHLRIVAPRDRGEHLLADLQHQTAAGHRLRRALHDLRLVLDVLGIDQRSDLEAELQRVDDELQAFGHEAFRLVAVLLVGERLDVLDDRVRKARDFLHLTDAAAPVMFLAHALIHRLKREVESARPACLPSVPLSRMTSSPDSTVPPAPRIVSRISSWME